MEQSVITDDTLAVLTARAESVIERDLNEMERAVLAYAVDQIRYGLIEVN
jgi:hypothetical protein